MYLTELYRFYERMTQDPQSGMPPEGMSAEAIHFALVIGEDGSLKGVHDLRDSKGKPLRRFVPAAVSRSSNVAANFLWDKTELTGHTFQSVAPHAGAWIETCV